MSLNSRLTNLAGLGLSFRMPLRLTLALLLGTASAVAGVAAAPTLENDALRITLLPGDGSLASVENKLTQETHAVEATTFLIYTDRGELSPATAPLKETSAAEGRIALRYEHPAAQVDVVYTLAPANAFVQKTISVTNRAAEPILLQEILAERYRFTPAFDEAYLHDDGTDWKCPINVFLRTRKGGLYTGVQNPYFEMIAPGAWQATRLDLRFAPRWRLAPGERFEAEPSFLGAYKRENIYFFKEMQSFHYMKQQQIVMDWGEVWAMQAFMRAIMPVYDLPYPGYYLRANGVDYFTNLGIHTPEGGTSFGKPKDYWIPHSHAPFEAEMAEAGKSFVDILAKQGNIESIDWGTIWLGQAGWLRETPDEYLEKLGEDFAIEPNPHWLELIEYAKAKGFDVGIMDEGGARDYMKYDDRWKIKDREGKPVAGVVQFEGLMGRNCWANPAFAQWWTRVVSETITKYNVPIWGTDAGTIWWVPFDPPLECHDPNHGHPLGDCGYYAWRNIMDSTAELRRRHPHVALRNAGGIHRGYPWVLRDWVEYHGYLDPVSQNEGGTINDNIRFQGWHARSLRFIPVYKSAGGFRTDDPYSMAYGAFTHMTGGDHGEGSAVPPMGITDAAEQQAHVNFYRKWTAWLDEHVEFMRVRVDILGEPRTNKLDGSAHCIDDRGFVFIYNPSKETRAASVPLNHWIGLTEGEAYRVEYLEPAAKGSSGVYKRGESMLIPVEAQGVVAVSIGPASLAEVDSSAGAAAAEGLPVDKAFHSAADLKERFGAAITIPAEAE